MIPSIGVDIGGTKVLAAVVDAAGRVLDTEATATPGHGMGVEGATVAEVEDALVDVTGRLLAVYGRCPVGRRRRRLRRPRRAARAVRAAPALARRAALAAAQPAARRTDPGRRPRRQRRHGRAVGRGQVRRGPPRRATR